MMKLPLMNNKKLFYAFKILLVLIVSFLCLLFFCSSCYNSNFDKVSNYREFNEELLFYVIDIIKEKHEIELTKPLFYYPDVYFSTPTFLEMKNDDSLKFIEKNNITFMESFKLTKSSWTRNKDKYNMLHIPSLSIMRVDKKTKNILFEIIVITRYLGEMKITFLYIQLNHNKFELKNLLIKEADSYFLSKFYFD